MPFNVLPRDLLNHISSFIHDKSLFYLLVANKHLYSFVKDIALDLSEEKPTHSMNSQLRLIGVHFLTYTNNIPNISNLNDITKLRLSFTSRCRFNCI
jgi:hypothetical protein